MYKIVGIIPILFTLIITTSSLGQTIDEWRDTVRTSDFLEGELLVKPVTGSKVITVIPTNSEIYLNGYEKGTPYLKVEYDKQNGWMRYGSVAREYLDSPVISELEKFWDYSKVKDRSSERSKYQKPSPPLGEPDKTFEYESGDYKSVTYTYFCLNGKYRTFTYKRSQRTDGWELESKSTSDGVCY